jgi:signal transduction histidine kinase
MRSLRTRLLFGVGALVVLAVTTVAVAARRTTRVELHQYLERAALDRREGAIDALEAAVTERGAAGLAASDLPLVAARLPAGFGVFLLGPRGELLAASGPGIAGVAGRAVAGADEATVAVRRRADDVFVTLRRGGDTAELALRGGGLRVPLAGSVGGHGTLHLLPLPAGAAAGTERLLGAVDRRLLAVTAGIGALALVLAAVVGHRLLVPIRELQVATRRLAAGERGRRVAVERGDELGELARSFNAMAAELERQERLRKDLVADVAHELRAPLTTLRCRIETMQDHLDRDPEATLAGLHLDVAQLSRLVDDLQELALADAGQLRIEAVDGALLPLVEAGARAVGLDGDPRLAIAVPPDLQVTADPVRVRQVVANLLGNAARHTPRGGTIRVTATRAGEEARVEVVDTGCGLAADQLERAFERFWRSDPSRQRETGGSGLGLAIVRSLVEAHGGRVWARSVPGEGAAFGFALPAP